MIRLQMECVSLNDLAVSVFPDERAQAMIRVDGVTQHYGVKPVLKNISLEIPAGSRTVVIGPNGMGKTTFLSVLGGVLDPQEGYVEFDGLRRRSSVENELAIRKRVVFLPDRGFLPKERTGREFLLGVGRLYEIEENRLIDHAQRLLELFHLAKLAESPIRTYSAGQQKKISLASALMTNAEVFLLDEPFWKARPRKRKSMMLPSCGCSQLSLVVGTGPRFSRSMCTAPIRRLRKASRQVMAVQTSVGPEAAIILSSGHSTTVTNGNMYSFLAIAASWDAQCTTVGSR